MDDATRETINNFLAQYDTFAIATEDQGQPYVTRAFYVEQSVQESSLKLYGTFITTSRKLANLQRNPRVGLFIGPSQPTVWLEATAQAYIITEEATRADVRKRLSEKSAVAAGFIAQVPIAEVELQVNWLRITNIAASPMQIEATFPIAPLVEGKK